MPSASSAAATVRQSPLATAAAASSMPASSSSAGAGGGGGGGASSRARGDSDGTAGSGKSLGKSALASRAEQLPRAGAGFLCSGYLRKKNSADKWQKRWFEVLAAREGAAGGPAAFFVYYKSRESADLLCAMDLWRSSRPELLVAETAAERAAAAAAGAGAGAGAKAAAAAAATAAAAAAAREGECDFAITWDRYRVFRAASRAEAVRFVAAIADAQARNPAAGERPAASPAAFAAVVEQRAAVRASGRDPNAATYGTAGERTKTVAAANWGETAAAAKGKGKGKGGDAGAGAGAGADAGAGEASSCGCAIA